MQAQPMPENRWMFNGMTQVYVCVYRCAGQERRTSKNKTAPKIEKAKIKTPNPVRK